VTHSTRTSGVAGRPQGRPAATLEVRGKWGAGHRPAPRALAALVALLAMGAGTALFTPSPVAAQAEGEPAASPPASPPDNSVEPDTQATDPPPSQPPAVRSEAPRAEEAPTPPQWVDHATFDVPPSAADAPRSDTHLAPAPTQSAPTQSAPADDDATQQPATDQESEEPSQSSGVVAQNVSRVLQAIWQVQVGCRTYCNGTSQTQLASQQSETNQNATAIAPEGQSSGAAAVNQSSTLQFVWQEQLGCVAFCWNTRMDQSASQNAETTQMATAVSDFGALAENLAETLQYVWQVQEGCQVECYGVSQSQSLSQQQRTSQSATATGPRLPTSAGAPAGGREGFFSWVTAFAQSIGATVQWILQVQEASCLEHCGDDALLQVAGQRASTDQTSTAGNVPEPGGGAPTTEEPPAAGQPQAGEPPPSGSATTAATATASAASAQGAGAGALDPEGPRSDRSIAALAEGRMSTQATSRGSRVSSIASADAPTHGTPKQVSGTDVEQSDPAARASTLESSSASTSRSSARIPASSAPGTLDTIAATTEDEEPGLPWLPVALVLLAGLAIIQSLRLRPGFRG
jgi:hypothetical protein